VRRQAGLAVILALALAPPATAGALVSVDVGRLNPGDNVSGFDIRIEGGHILALCRLPEAWDVKLGNYGETGGDKTKGAYLSGEAQWMHAAFKRPGDPALKALFLVAPDAPGRPVRLSGHIKIFRVDAEDTTRDLPPGAFSRQAATRCP
jgi:hypothetical protein